MDGATHYPPDPKTQTPRQTLRLPSKSLPESTHPNIYTTKVTTWHKYFLSFLVRDLETGHTRPWVVATPPIRTRTVSTSTFSARTGQKSGPRPAVIKEYKRCVQCALCQPSPAALPLHAPCLCAFAPRAPIHSTHCALTPRSVRLGVCWPHYAIVLPACLATS